MTAGGVRIERERVIELTLRHRLACALPEREYVEAGGLLSYRPQRQEAAARILRLPCAAPKPADLPVDSVRAADQPEDREGARRDDRAVGSAAPADEVIE